MLPDEPNEVDELNEVDEHNDVDEQLFIRPDHIGHPLVTFRGSQLHFLHLPEHITQRAGTKGPTSTFFPPIFLFPQEIDPKVI